MSLHEPDTVTKHPTEDIYVSMDFTPRLADTETVVSATATVVEGGAITLDPVVDVIDDAKAVCEVLGGTAGQTDSILFNATTNTGEILAAVVDVAVNARVF